MLLSRILLPLSHTLSCSLLIPALLLAQPRPTPLWPASHYTTADRDSAIDRGMAFIYRQALDPAIFADHGHDLLWCFYTISATAKNPKLRATARKMGHERALEYRRIHAVLPPDVSADDLGDLVFGFDAAARLGLPDSAMKEQLRRAAKPYSAEDFLLFDPTREPPPSDYPKQCGKCDEFNPRGDTVCQKCGNPLNMRSRYDIWSDALIATYTGDIYGVMLGAHYRDVIRWIKVMRPYAPRATLSTGEFYDITYSITHVIYTLNDYGMHLLSPAWLPPEYQYLKSNLEEAVKLQDPETLGEFLDTLRAFGLTEADPLIRVGVDYLLSKQNPDGSWGDPAEPDPYTRYHSTWTAVDGLRQYAWHGERLSFPALQKLIAVTEPRP
jgi:hypothetical protein